MAARADIVGEVLLRCRRVGVGVRFDRVDAMTVSAHRGLLIAARNRLAVNALHEGGLNVHVALAAGGGHVELVNWRLRVVRWDDLVRAVTVRADRGLLRSLFGSAPVHAFLVADERLRALAAGFHKEFLPVAAPACTGNVLVTDRRFRIVRGENLVGAAVAVLASGGGSTRIARGGVRTVRIGMLRIGVTLGAGDLLRRRVVSQALHILVAIDARKHGAVDGVLELALIDKQADGFAVDVFRQRRVAVAGETFGILELLRRGCCGSPNENE